MENTLITKIKAKSKLSITARSLYNTELQDTLLDLHLYSQNYTTVNILHRSWQDELDQTLCFPAFIANKCSTYQLVG